MSFPIISAYSSLPTQLADAILNLRMASAVHFGSLLASVATIPYNSKNANEWQIKCKIARNLRTVQLFSTRAEEKSA